VSTFGREYDYAFEEQRRRRSQEHKANGQWRDPPRQERTAAIINLIPFEKIKLEEGHRPYLIHGLIPAKGLTVAWGPPKCGKTFTVTEMLLTIALGWDYRGRKVQQGPVVYCSFEGQAGLAGRIEAFRQKHMGEDPDPIPFHAVTATLDLVRQADDLIASIKDADIQPLAVCLDTLNRSLMGSENNDQDMGAYIAACDRIREALDCAVIIIHHCGIQGTRPRGHTSLTGAADAQLAFSRDRNSNVEMRVEYMKDGGSEGEVVVSSLQSVEVGVDADDLPITSCVVVPAVAVEAGPRVRKLPANQGTMLALLRESMPEGMMRDEWYNKAKAEGIGKSRPATLTDLRMALQDAKLVHSYADRYYVSNP
jgi:hypothetical protein